jgi:hypothetical protein
MIKKIQPGPLVILSLIIILIAGCAPRQKPEAVLPVRPLWLGLHVLLESRAAAEELINEIPGLAQVGVNLLIAEVNYNYEYTSHPELRSDDPIPRATVKQLLALCRSHNIRLIPEFECLGHQSWAKKTFPLLTHYPEFDETPGQYPENKDIYCRSWCPLHPEINPIVFALFDELIEAFEADAFHIGMDEVFLIASEFCPLCRGRDPAELYAKAVNDYYGHLVKERGLEMLMWGDRLLDGAATGYGEWEASMNKTYPAVDLIPKDIIICDWHYTKRKSYPSIPLFLNKGFRVLPTGWREVKAAKALIDYSLAFPSERLLGHLSTIWKAPKTGETVKWPPLLAASKKLRPFLSFPGGTQSSTRSAPERKSQ